MNRSPFATRLRSLLTASMPALLCLSESVLGADPICLDGIPVGLPGLDGKNSAFGSQTSCPLDPRESPEYWRGRFCEDPVGFCEEIETHPLPLPACTRSTERILGDYEASGLKDDDVPALFPPEATEHVRKLLPEAKQALLEVIGSPKWQAPQSVRDSIAGARLVDPNDPATAAEDIELLNMMCHTKIDAGKYARREPMHDEDGLLPDQLAKRRRLQELQKELLALGTEESGPGGHLTLGLQAAVNDDGAILVCPATLRLAKDGPPEAFLSILLHELGHLSGPCNIGQSLVQEAAVPELGSCEVDPLYIDGTPDGRNRLDYVRRLHERMRCFEDRGLSRPGKSAKLVGSLVTEVTRRTGNHYDCLFSEAQLVESRKSKLVTGLMQTCQLSNVKMMVLLQNALWKVDESVRESAVLAAIRNFKILKTMNIPNENQFIEAHSDALSAEALPSALSRLRRAGKLSAPIEPAEGLRGLLHAPAVFCGLKTTGLFRKRHEHGPEEQRARTVQLTPEFRKALGCSLDTRGASAARDFDSCVMRDPLSPVNGKRAK